MTVRPSILAILMILLLPACSDGDGDASGSLQAPSVGITSRDALLDEICRLASECVPTTAGELAQCPAEILAQLDPDDLADLDAFLALDKAEQDAILDCFGDWICRRFGGSILNLSDSDVMEPLLGCP